MTMPSTAALLESIGQFGLLEPEQLAQVRRRRWPDSHNLAEQLVRCGWLTPYQATQLLTGHAAELSLGSYVLLERLGQGAMGHVYKARHRTLGRVVALKVLRKELLSDPDNVRRFHREIRAVAHVTHPNI